MVRVNMLGKLGGMGAKCYQVLRVYIYIYTSVRMVCVSVYTIYIGKMYLYMGTGQAH